MDNHLFVFQGPYFQEFLSWSVNEDCELILKCKVLLYFYILYVRILTYLIYTNHQKIVLL